MIDEGLTRSAISDGYRTFVLQGRVRVMNGMNYASKTSPFRASLSGTIFCFFGSHRIHGTNGKIDPHLVDSYGKLVGKYTVRPMDLMGLL